MKKLISLAVACTLGLAFLFTSCDKEKTYNCECTLVMGNQTQTTNSPIKTKKKKDAKDACDEMHRQMSTSAPGSSCKLK